MNMTDFRAQYEPFRGKFHEFGNYRIKERYIKECGNDFLVYECEHAGNVFSTARFFEDAVNKCRRHSAAHL